MVGKRRVRRVEYQNNEKEIEKQKQCHQNFRANIAGLIFNSYLQFTNAAAA
jgi:hypothetical protein